MSIDKLLTLWSSNATLSAVVWTFLIVLSLYLARGHAHRAIRSAMVIVRNALRIAARSLLGAEHRLSQRTREVLLANGRESCERLLQQEFHRVNAVVSRDLSAYPSLHRRLCEQIEHIDNDYHRASEALPPPPDWVHAVEAVAKLRKTDQTMLSRILTDIHDTAQQAQRDALEEYKQANARRHDLLRQMMPYWRRLSQTLDEVRQSINGLQERSQVIDHQMAHYEQILARSDHAERMLASSSMTQFFIAGLVLAIAIVGGIINFYLIALPMSEMVGGGSLLGPFKTSSVAALVIIMLEVAMGLFLMESLRITRMFPVIGALDDRMRRRMIAVTFAILFILACVESSLAFMRDLLAADREALRQTLSGIVASNPEFRWIPSLGQMIMGFILPFALTFVAIPLESFIHALRTVIGVVLAALLRASALLLRLLGNTAVRLGSLVVNLYDLLIFIPLKLEDVLRQRRTTQDKPPAERSLTVIERNLRP